MHFIIKDITRTARERERERESSPYDLHSLWITDYYHWLKFAINHTSNTTFSLFKQRRVKNCYLVNNLILTWNSNKNCPAEDKFAYDEITISF